MDLEVKDTSNEVSKIILKRGEQTVEKRSINDDMRVGRIVEILIIDHENSLRVNDLAPQGWRIMEKRNEHPRVDKKTNLILIPEIAVEVKTAQRWGTKDSFVDSSEDYVNHRFLQMRGSFLTLLHEIGHAWNYEKWTKEDLERFELFRTTQDKLFGGDMETTKTYAELNIKNERDAWAFAISTLRMLRAMGINLEPGMTNRDIIDYMSRNLAFYEWFGVTFIEEVEKKGEVFPEQLKRLTLRRAKIDESR